MELSVKGENDQRRNGRKGLIRGLAVCGVNDVSDGLHIAGRIRRGRRRLEEQENRRKRRVITIRFEY